MSPRSTAIGDHALTTFPAPLIVVAVCSVQKHKRIALGGIYYSGSSLVVVWLVTARLSGPVC